MADEQTENTDEQTTPPEAAAAPAAPERAAAPAVEPGEVIAPKERRRRARAAKAAKVPARAPRTTEERLQERVAQRRAKASERRTGRERARAKARAEDHSSVQTPPREHAPGKQKSRQGVVTSDRADKTITVRIDLARRHRRYDKIVRTSTTLHVHDERNDAHTGDTVVVRECRPLSRTKRWRLIEILERAK
jgi:small subunit ribosomal protein S17